jgi:hypothetical protein
VHGKGKGPGGLRKGGETREQTQMSEEEIEAGWRCHERTEVAWW